MAAEGAGPGWRVGGLERNGARSDSDQDGGNHGISLVRPCSGAQPVRHLSAIAFGLSSSFERSTGEHRRLSVHLSTQGRRTRPETQPALWNSGCGLGLRECGCIHWPRPEGVRDGDAARAKSRRGGGPFRSSEQKRYMGRRSRRDVGRRVRCGTWTVVDKRARRDHLSEEGRSGFDASELRRS